MLSGAKLAAIFFLSVKIGLQYIKYALPYKMAGKLLPGGMAQALADNPQRLVLFLAGGCQLWRETCVDDFPASPDEK
ncbi:hypothetical protein [Dysgonomonas termitidis]|uniref:Uncharacterized protein n=1 Tax=Dysgonomonas termitidis TaxID=1516126 RepID=A0ABV9L2K1_9BACT